MDDQKFDVIHPAPAGDKRQQRAYGLSHMVATGACTALATAGLAFAVGQAKPQSTSSAPSPAPIVAAEQEKLPDASGTTDQKGDQKTADGQKPSAGSAEQPKVTEDINKTAEAEKATTSESTTPIVQVVGVPIQAQSENGNSNTNTEQVKEPVWVDEVGHWNYDTVTDYEERTVYKDVPNYVDTIVYRCSEGDFESTDVSEVIAHCEEHGTSIRSEVRQSIDGTRKEADGTEMVAVGTHQELGEWVVDVPGHWE